MPKRGPEMKLVAVPHGGNALDHLIDLPPAKALFLEAIS